MNPKKMLLAIPFAAVMALGPSAAEAVEKRAPRCRVGNGKGVSYLDSVHACQKARAEGRDVTMVDERCNDKADK